MIRDAFTWRLPKLDLTEIFGLPLIEFRNSKLNKGDPPIELPFLWSAPWAILKTSHWLSNAIHTSYLSYLLIIPLQELNMWKVFSFMDHREQERLSSLGKTYILEQG